jgi:N-acetylmuramoyl-L-alanine amidase
MPTARWFFVLLFAQVLTACSPALRSTLPSNWQPSPNHDERRPNYIVIHHTSDDSVEQALRTLRDPLRQVSAHYLIGRDGTLYQLVDERRRAWHAGESAWGSDRDLNSASIGIELDNNGSEPFPQAQIDALLALLADLTQRHRIPHENILGHADIAPARKADPSKYFPWKTLADHGYGLWCDGPAAIPPATFDAVSALRILGYDTADTAAAYHAFRLHYAHDDATSDLSPQERATLNCLQQKKLTGGG